MNVFQRAFISIKRQKGQTFILIGVVFLLSTSVAGAISVNQAIMNTDKALRAQLPAVAVLRQDETTFANEWNETGIWPQRENLTTGLLHELGSHPYVRSFNYSVQAHGFYSETLVRSWYPELFLGAYDPIPDAIDDFSLSHWFTTPFERFILNGVGNSNIWEMEADIIHLVKGRVFNENEIQQSIPVAVVSQSFLNANNLSLGDIFILEHMIHDYRVPDDERYHTQHVLASRTYNFEIIGVFDHEIPDSRVLYGRDFQEHIEILNQIFVPATFVESIYDLYLEIIDDQEVLEMFQATDNIMDLLEFSNMYFLLYDPLDLPAFHSFTDVIIPEFWMMSDYSFVYADIAESMALVRYVTDGLLIGVTLAFSIVLGLLLLLFLRVRKNEIGIYLALGESRLKILGHMLFEAFTPTLIGITLGLFVGNVVSSEISTNMIHQHLRDIAADESRIVEFYEVLGIRHEITHEEMLELYEVRMDRQTIIIFYTISSGIILISIVMPMFFVLKMNPKNMLMLQ